MKASSPAHPSLAEQLAPLAPKIREVRSRIRAVSQVSLRLGATSGKDRFGSTIDGILRWADGRAGHRMPKEALEHKSFELSEIGSQRLAAVALDDPQIWALRLDDADKNVPLRTWITEVGVGVAPDNDVLFGVRVICATRGEDAPYARTIPSFVPRIIAAGPASLDGRVVGAGPQIIASEADADELVAFLESPERRAPAYVFALPEKSTNALETIVPAKDFEARTRGVAHAFILTGPASFHLTDRLGRELSVFRHAVRTYLPGFKRWKDQPYRHPLALPERILAWPGGGASGFLDQLVSNALALTVQAPDREEVLPSFTTIRQWIARVDRERARSENQNDSELLRLALDENQKLESEVRELKERYSGLNEETARRAEEAEQAAQEAKAQNYALKQRVEALERRAAANGAASRDQPLPEALDEFRTWCDENLSGAVVLHNRAYQGIKKSVFKDVGLIYKALLVLRDRYVPMRKSGTPQDKAAYDAALQELRLEDSATGHGWKEHKEQYMVTYEGKQRLLDRHLKFGISRNPVLALRLYFFWDEESELVVVGWLPSHLNNALT